MVRKSSAVSPAGQFRPPRRRRRATEVGGAIASLQRARTLSTSQSACHPHVAFESARGLPRARRASTGNTGSTRTRTGLACRRRDQGVDVCSPRVGHGHLANRADEAALLLGKETHRHPAAVPRAEVRDEHREREQGRRAADQQVAKAAQAHEVASALRVGRVEGGDERAATGRLLSLVSQREATARSVATSPGIVQMRSRRVATSASASSSSVSASRRATCPPTGRRARGVPWPVAPGRSDSAASHRRRGGRGAPSGTRRHWPPRRRRHRGSGGPIARAPSAGRDQSSRGCQGRGHGAPPAAGRCRSRRPGSRRRRVHRSIASA
jgi:hypothetical protein